MTATGHRLRAPGEELFRVGYGEWTVPFPGRMTGSGGGLSLDPVRAAQPKGGLQPLLHTIGTSSGSRDPVDEGYGGTRSPRCSYHCPRDGLP